MNMRERPKKETIPWYDGPCFFEVLDDLESPDRDPTKPFRWVCASSQSVGLAK